MNEANTTFEKDACGVGFVYRRQSSNQVIREALTALSRMEHRGACGADGVTGDGSGILTAIPGLYLPRRILLFLPRLPLVWFFYQKPGLSFVANN
jgi:glutamate synthase (NADPH/NADH) large chain